MLKDVSLKEALIKTIKDYPYKIAQDIGFADVREFPHNEWMKAILTGQEDYTLLAHRGSYKSSVLSVCIALMMVLLPKKNIIFLRKADNDVFEMIRMVKKALESKIIQSMSYILYHKKLVLTESTASTITTNLFLSVSGSSQLLGIGLKSSITGKHADIVITDDICNISDRISKAERDRTKMQYQELQNIRNRGGRIINTGTKWHKDDVFVLTPNIHTYDYKQTGLIPEEKIEELRKNMIPSLFACNYELRIIASDDVVFASPQTGADVSLVEQGTAHIDAAYHGEDFTAYTVAKIHDGKYYVFGKLWRKHVNDVLDQILDIHHSLMGGKIYCEDNGDKGYLGRDLRKKGERVIIYSETMNKYLKITSYLKFEWENVIFVKGTDEAYINQICDFNDTVEHDDAPDSLASLIRIMPNRQRREDVLNLFN